MAPPRPLSARKLDALYLTFFIIHIPIMLLVDLVPLEPEWMRTQLSYDLRSHLVERYKDRFFTAPTAWFTTYMYLEALYSLPLSLWMVWAIPTDHPLVPLHLLLFAVETALTTMTCVVDMTEWPGLPTAERNGLFSLYVPYLILAILMAIDCLARVQKQILQREAKGKTA